MPDGAAGCLDLDPRRVQPVTAAKWSCRDGGPLIAPYYRGLNNYLYHVGGS